MAQRHSWLLGGFLAAFGGVCWGASSCMAQYLFEHTPLTAEWLVSVRMVAAGALLLVMGCVTCGAKNTFLLFTSKGEWPRFLAFSLLGMLWSQYGYFGAIERSNAPTATVLQATSAVFVLVFSCAMLRRLPAKIEAAAIAACVVGAWLLCTHGDFSAMHLSAGALGFGLAAAAGGALYTVLSGPLLARHSTWSVVGGAMLLDGMVMCLLNRPWNLAVNWTVPALVNLAGVIVVGTAAAFSLYLKGASLAGPVLASMMGRTEPITSILLSAAMLGTRFEMADYVGFVLIVAAALTVSVSSARTRNAKVKTKT